MYIDLFRKSDNWLSRVPHSSFSDYQLSRKSISNISDISTAETIPSYVFFNLSCLVSRQHQTAGQRILTVWRPSDDSLFEKSATCNCNCQGYLRAPTETRTRTRTRTWSWVQLPEQLLESSLAASRCGQAKLKTPEGFAGFASATLLSSLVCVFKLL